MRPGKMVGPTIMSHNNKERCHAITKINLDEKSALMSDFLLNALEAWGKTQKNKSNELYYEIINYLRKIYQKKRPIRAKKRCKVLCYAKKT